MPQPVRGPACGTKFPVGTPACPSCGRPSAPVGLSPEAVNAAVVRSFRKECAALGGVWVFFGLLALAGAGLAVSASAPGQSPTDGLSVAVLVFLLAMLWLSCGAGALLRNITAVQVGMYATGVFMAIGLIGLFVGRGNVCGLFLGGLIVAQAKRVIDWADRMEQAGIPLDTRPEDLERLSDPAKP